MENVLEKIKWKLLAEEGITKDDLDLVMLEIQFTPVIAIRGESIKDAVEVTETVGGKYLVHHPLINGAVSEDELKVMRYRYLISRRNHYV